MHTGDGRHTFPLPPYDSLFLFSPNPPSSFSSALTLTYLRLNGYFLAVRGSLVIVSPCDILNTLSTLSTLNSCQRTASRNACVLTPLQSAFWEGTFCCVFIVQLNASKFRKKRFFRIRMFDLTFMLLRIFVNFKITVRNLFEC